MSRQAPTHAEHPPLTDLQPLFLDEAAIGNGAFGEPNSVMVPTLTFLSPDARGREVPILKQQLVIGRGDDCDVRVIDASVSRHHAQLSCRRVLGSAGPQQFRVVLRDLGSPDGTLINSRRVQRAVLRPGDRIFMGRVVLRFDYRDLADREFFDRVYRMATTDSLTMLLNRSMITRVLEEEAAKRRRYSRRLSILRVDLDDFRSLIDTHGPALADRVLQSVGRIMRRAIRRNDSAGRLGDGEFLIIQPETGLKGAAASAERIRSEIEAMIAPALRLERKITVSIGVGACRENGGGLDAILKYADSALCRAKARGKNRVEVWRERSALPAGNGARPVA
jgi:two-component system cell cycle response regulator